MYKLCQFKNIEIKDEIQFVITLGKCNYGKINKNVKTCIFCIVIKIIQFSMHSKRAFYDLSAIQEC